MFKKVVVVCLFACLLTCLFLSLPLSRLQECITALDDPIRPILFDIFKTRKFFLSPPKSPDFKLAYLIECNLRQRNCGANNTVEDLSLASSKIKCVWLKNEFSLFSTCLVCCEKSAEKEENSCIC